MTDELVLDLNEQMTIRRDKLKAWREQGHAYPNTFKPQHQAAELLAKYNSQTKETLEKTPINVVVAGRIMLRREMGKASFCHIQDVTGRIQVYLRKEQLPDGVYDDF